MYVDTVLGREIGHGRRTDVADPQGKVAQPFPQIEADCVKLFGPRRVPPHDLDCRHSCLRSGGFSGHGDGISHSTELRKIFRILVPNILPQVSRRSEGGHQRIGVEGQ